MTLGTYNLEDLKSWVECFHKSSGKASSSSKPNVNENVRPVTLKLKNHISALESAFGEAITSDKSIKLEVCIQNTAENIKFAIENSRLEWDSAFKLYRQFSCIDSHKIFHAEVNSKKTALLLSTSQDAQYIKVESIPHKDYPSNLKFYQYFQISSNGTNSRVSMITDLPELAESFKNFPSYMETLPFPVPENTLVEDSPITEEVVSVDSYSFEEFFVYGPGGRYERDETKGSLVFNDRELMSKQKKVLKYMLQKIGRNILSGKSIMSISLPISIFDSKSILQRTCDKFGYAPIFLQKAMQLKDVEKFKQVLALAVTTLHMCTEQRKPFNPILGETYQGNIGPMAVFAEQTSHHPPISHFQMVGDGYEINGFSEYIASTSLNSVKARPKGITKIVVGDDSYFLSFPQIHITGAMYGNRVFSYIGVLTLMDPKNKLFCEIVFSPDKKGYFKKGKSLSDYFKGNIYRVAESHPMLCANTRRGIEDDGKKTALVNCKDNLQEVGAVHGYWPLFLEVDGVKYWEFTAFRPYKLVDCQHTLPSDSIHRKDLTVFISGNEDLAQKYKEEMENLQRHDKKLRGHK